MKVLSLLHMTPKGAGNTYHETPGAVFILISLSEEVWTSVVLEYNVYWVSLNMFAVVLI